MKVVLATGIYPPEIGGPATYVRALAAELSKKNIDVTVITYGEPHTAEDWRVITVSKSIPILRWIAYAFTLRAHGKDADAVIAFSSMSAGVPLWLAHLKKPKKILRLAGIRDVWVKTFGNTSARINLITAVFDALKKLYVYEKAAAGVARGKVAEETAEEEEKMEEETEEGEEVDEGEEVEEEEYEDEKIEEEVVAEESEEEVEETNGEVDEKVRREVSRKVVEKEV